jgi:hypothetical protein
MPGGPHSATVEDCPDSDQDHVASGARRDAGEQPPPTKPMPHLFHRNHRDTASDSGYSSHTSNTMSSSSHSQPASNFRPPPPPTTQHTAPNQSKPLTRSDSQRHQSRPSRSASIAKSQPPCRCDEPDCADKRSVGRGQALPHRPHSHHAPQHPPTTQYPVQDTAPYSQAPNHPYVPVPHAQPMPNYSQQPQPRQLPPSASQSRPSSWVQPPGFPINHQYGMLPQANYNAQQYGLQGSPSAYPRSYLGHQQSASGDWSSMAPPMVSGSPRDSFGSYMHAPGIAIPSSGQAYRPPMSHSYSARQAIPTISSRDSLTPATERAQAREPVPSARRRSDMPGSFPKEGLHFESYSDTSSESSDSEDEGQHRHARHQSRREETRRILEDQQRMPPPRRPILKATHITPAVETGRPQSRGPSRRARNSVPQFISSEFVDPRSSGKHPSRNRQPSVSHHDQPGRNKSGSISRGPRVDEPLQYIVEDANGRKTYYDTRAEAEAKALRLKQQQREDDTEAYLAANRGAAHPSAPSAESVKHAQKTHQRRPASHVSGTSRKSTTSSARTTSDSIQITRDGTTYSIPTNTTLQIRQTEEGETWVIGPGSPPREHSFYDGSSKSSGSRVGGRRNGSERGSRRRDTKTEDDGYEPRL